MLSVQVDNTSPAHPQHNRLGALRSIRHSSQRFLTMMHGLSLLSPTLGQLESCLQEPAQGAISSRQATVLFTRTPVITAGHAEGCFSLAGGLHAQTRTGSSFLPAGTGPTHLNPITVAGWREAPENILPVPMIS